jgi:hypothetical protein
MLTARAGRIPRPGIGGPAILRVGLRAIVADRPADAATVDGVEFSVVLCTDPGGHGWPTCFSAIWSEFAAIVARP